MDDEDIKNMDTPQGKPKKEKYSLNIHYGAMAIYSIFFGFFAAAANFSGEAIFGSFCLGAFFGEFLGVVFNWILITTKD